MTVVIKFGRWSSNPISAKGAQKSRHRKRLVFLGDLLKRLESRAFGEILRGAAGYLRIESLAEFR
jgi:hypothetical protein